MRPSPRFKDRLRAVREGLRRMSQAELAKAAGLPASSIAHFEGGARKPSFDSLGKLASALNVTTDYLIGESMLPRLRRRTIRCPATVHDYRRVIANSPRKSSASWPTAPTESVSAEIDHRVSL